MTVVSKEYGISTSSTLIKIRLDERVIQSIVAVCTVLYIDRLRFVTVRNNHSNEILFLNQLT